MTSTTPYTYWTELADDELTVDSATRTLDSITDDFLAAAAAAERVVDDIQVQRTLLDLGIARTFTGLRRSKAASQFFHLSNESSASYSRRLSSPETGSEAGTETLRLYFESKTQDAQLCDLRATLLQRLDLLNTFVEITRENTDGLADEDEMEGWEDDPWADTAITSCDTPKTKSSLNLPFSLSTFLVNDPVEIACQLASMQWFGALQILMARHGPLLWPFRYAILESVPEYVHPADLRDLLPSFDICKNTESIPVWRLWRVAEDWSESSPVQAALNLLHGRARNSPSISPRPIPLTADELSMWYKSRVDGVIDMTGLIDIALATIQHGASQGIPDLDEIGEDLSLLSRLVYDAPQDLDRAEDWTMAQWTSMGPSAVVRAYLIHSTPDFIAKDISRLVLPYLFVLESRAERAGSPDPDLPTRILYDYILSAPLDLVASVFAASKPTLPTAHRLVKNDEDIARLALACLYGNDGLNQWTTMSEIFECLPAWDTAADENQDDATKTIIPSLGNFVAPSTVHPHYTASDLIAFFKPLSIASLSRALDILDVHLESGEILSRWSVPAPLKWFLQSNGDIMEQRAWANKMARRARGSNAQLNTLEDWEWLLGDMLKLIGKGDTGISGAFGLLTREEVIHIFVSGLLNYGDFDIARDFIEVATRKLSIQPTMIEEICLKCSREFYDNAQSGNFKFGDMKLAYDCLNIPPSTERIVREKEFIEATSRITSFNVTSRPGIPISPIEIRLTNDRLSLISRVLSSNIDAYKHTEVVLDLVYKLGFRDDTVAEVKTLAMLADTALQAEDFPRAYDLSERMFHRTLELHDESSIHALADSRVAEANEVCWVTCFQLGRQMEFPGVKKRLILLGRALELCPPEKIPDVLMSCGRLTKEDLQVREQTLSINQSRVASSASRERTRAVPGNVTFSLRARLQEFHMPSPPMLSTPDAAALASRTFRTVTANFPFSIGHRGHSQFSDKDEGGSHSSSLLRSDGEVMSTQATRAFSKGIGWLIGADDGT